MYRRLRAPKGQWVVLLALLAVAGILLPACGSGAKVAAVTAKCSRQAKGVTGGYLRRELLGSPSGPPVPPIARSVPLAPARSLYSDACTLLGISANLAASAKGKTEPIGGCPGGTNNFYFLTFDFAQKSRSPTRLTLSTGGCQVLGYSAPAALSSGTVGPTASLLGLGLPNNHPKLTNDFYAALARAAGVPQSKLFAR